MNNLGLNIKLPDLDLARNVLCGSKVERIERVRASYGFRFGFYWSYEKDCAIFRIYGENKASTALLTEFDSKNEEFKWVRRHQDYTIIQWEDLPYNFEVGAYDLNAAFNKALNEHYQRYLEEVAPLYDEP